jgi:signal transduction histidine kinase
MQLNEKEDVQADIEAIARVEGISEILHVLTETTRLRTALVARVTSTTWTLCAILDGGGFGLRPGDKLEVATTYCSSVLDSHAPLIIHKASEDPRFCSHPGFRRFAVETYIAVPLKRRNGEFFGTLCAFDTDPTQIGEERLPLFQLLAGLIALQLEAAEIAIWRETFLAILGHDLRNPLSTISMTAEAMQREPPPEPTSTSAERILRSSQRIERMVSQLLDLTRSRLADGLPIRPRPTDARDLMRQIITEFRASAPARTIQFVDAESVPAVWDPDRILQLFGNLVGNAISHSPPTTPVAVHVSSSAEAVRVEVSNEGEPIAEHVLPHLFKPFRRGASERSRNAGLGLGLYICQLIVSGHGGRIAVRSSSEGTVFTVDLPRHAAADSARPAPR